MTRSGQAVKNKVRLEIMKTERLVLEMELETGATVRDLLNEAATTHKEILEIAFDLQSQKLTGEMAVVLNGSLIQLLNALETKINDGDVVVLIPILVGG